MPDNTVPENPYGDPDLFDNPYIEYTYYPNGLKETERDPNGAITAYKYDYRSRLKELFTNNTLMFSYEYYDTGSIKQATDADGLVTKYEYDYLGQVLKQTVGSGAKTQQETRYTYDKLGNKTHEWYDYQETTYDAAKRKTQSVYNNLGLLTEVIDAKGKRTKYVYDAVGNIRRVTDASNNVTVYDYNNLGWLTSETYIGKTASYMYDAGGRRVSVTDRKLQTTAYEYYRNNLLKRVDYADGLAVVYEYDLAGNRKSVTQTDLYIGTDRSQGVTTWYNCDLQTKAYQPDPLNRVNNVFREMAEDLLYETKYSYDKMGNIVSIVYPGSTEAVEYNRDAFNRVSEIPGFTAPVGENSGIVYSNAGILKQVDLTNLHSLQITPDELHRPSEISYVKENDASALLMMLYEYKDNEMNIDLIQKTDRPLGETRDQTKRYDYDELDQLTSEGRTGLNITEIRQVK